MPLAVSVAPISVKYVTFKSPGELADEIDKDVWDIGLIGAEPQRAETIAFTSAYAEIEATYLVPSGSRLKAIADVNSEGVRIAVTARSAYGLWLDRNIKHADLIRSDTLDSAYEEFVNAKLSALTGLRPRLLSDLGKRIRAVTIDAARQIGQGDRLGSLEKDKEADFTILESDPYKVSPMRSPTSKSAIRGWRQRWRAYRERIPAVRSGDETRSGR